MSLDPHTLLFVATFAILVMAVALVLLWASDRREPATLWITGAMLLCATSAVLRETLPDVPAIIVANVLVAFGMGAIATGCRALNRQPVSWPGLAAAPAAWLLACAVPAFLASQWFRTVASSLSCAVIMAWALAELWRGRRERLVSRWALMAILGIQGLATLVRAGVTALSRDAGQGVARTADVSRTTFWAFGSLLLIGFALVFVLRERMQVQLRRYQDEDPLTGLANGRFFEKALDAAFAEAIDAASPLSVLALEADAAAADGGANPSRTPDPMLRTIAEVVAATVAPAHGVAAHRGEGRFAVLLPGAPPGDVLRIAEAMRRSVRDAAAPHRVTVGIGYATAVPAPGLEAAQLRLAADQALLDAQRNGGDRVLRSAFPEGGGSSPDPAVL